MTTQKQNKLFKMKTNLEKEEKSKSNPIRVQRNLCNFETAYFKDFYEHECLVEKSTIADDECIWLGIKEADPQIMAKHAHKYGIKTESSVGWVKYDIPEEVLLTTKMHLNREQVKELLPILINFVETGNLE